MRAPTETVRTIPADRHSVQIVWAGGYGIRPYDILRFHFQNKETTP
ncbi:MAG: hypothetical protein IJX76_01860 [Clostridia bacterium]|nr:hypothetical protein [Clostridia bacterium]